MVQLAIVLPYAWYIVWPYSMTGSAAGGMKITIAGMILGNVNMFISLQIFFTSYGLGFHRKDSMDIMILFSNTLLIIVNTFFNISTTAIMVFSQNSNGFGPDIFVTIKSLVAIGTESSLAKNIYDLMVPGTFFIGYAMCIVMAGVVPFVWNGFLMKLIYVWKCLPEPLLKILKVFLPWAPEDLTTYHARNAEKGFEPMEVGIGWDYSANIVNPTVCFCMLFFVSPYVWRMFAMMLGWAVFYYCFCRYQHLRFCKTCYYTTNRLDSMVNLMWGVPLSVVAAAWCSWGFRSGAFGEDFSVAARFALCAAAFFASCLLWVLSYYYFVQPWTDKDANEEARITYEDVKADTLYSWFNCNPVYVLKCAYYFLDEHGEANEERRNHHPIACGEDPRQVRFYEVGKEYLFVTADKQAFVESDLHDNLEIETHLERALAVIGGITDPFELFRRECKGKEEPTKELQVPRMSSREVLLNSP
mmetsp:Transcript_30165/g.76626  ORF Transcript_30165/g.76626 Transcript_30165/m.76626 type:complete len:472 (-) Transcript_30165:82-1497(-)